MFDKGKSVNLLTFKVKDKLKINMNFLIRQVGTERFWLSDGAGKGCCEGSMTYKRDKVAALLKFTSNMCGLTNAITEHTEGVIEG